MRTRLLALVAAVAALLGTALAVVPNAGAAPQPPGAPVSGNDFLKCTTPEQRYCVVSAKINNVEITGYDTPGAGTFKPFAQFNDAYVDVSFGVVLYSTPSDSDTDLGTNSDLYALRVNTGAVQPREMDGAFQDATFSIGRYPSGDWNFTISFRPTSRHTWSGGVCDFRVCGDDTTQADFDRNGWAQGSVSSLTGYPDPVERFQRIGSIRATSAQYENTMYDPDTDSIIVDLSNPHRTGTGAVITNGVYEAFLPNAYLIGQMEIPNPDTVTLASFVVTKPGGSAAAFSLTRTTRGIKIKITGISYSSPRFTMKVKPTVPGKPRLYDVIKTSRSTAKSKFYAPIANGNRRIDKYQARCHAAGRAWHYKSGSKTPITVRYLPRGKVYCQVRAHNVKGWGRWSAAMRS